MEAEFMVVVAVPLLVGDFVVEALAAFVCLADADDGDLLDLVVGAFVPAALALAALLVLVFDLVPADFVFDDLLALTLPVVADLAVLLVLAALLAFLGEADTRSCLAASVEADFLSAAFFFAAFFGVFFDDAAMSD